EPLHQPNSERPVCRLHPEGCPDHEEARPCSSCSFGWMRAGKKKINGQLDGSCIL
ncbi:hypothetical protein XENOCAPTIV_024859, partial [Xenoophorus captivus]